MGMSRIGIMTLVALGALAGGLLGCSTSGATGSPGATASPSATTQPSAAPASATPVPSASANAANAPALLQVECDGTRVGVQTPAVRTQPDGIHIRVANTSGRELAFAIMDAFGGGSGSSVAVGGETFVYTFGTGSYRLTCGDAMSPFSVVDPDGLFTPTDCPAPGSGTIGTNDYQEGATGPRGALLDIARAQLHGLKSGDAVERAGYPEAAGDQLVRVVRDGEVLVVLRYSDDGQGGWLLGVMKICSGSDVTIGSPDDTGDPPSPSQAATGAPSGAFRLQRAPTNLGCDSLPSTYQVAIIRIDPDRAEPVWAEADRGKRLGVLWSAGFSADDDGRPVVVGPKGEVVARDGERIEIPGRAWPSLHGYFVCAGADDIYVLENAPG